MRRRDFLQAGLGAALIAVAVLAPAGRASAVPVSITVYGTTFPFGSSLPDPMGESTGQVYYVNSTTGSSGNTGLTLGSPKQTVDQVASLLGTTSDPIIYLRGGMDYDISGNYLWPNTKFGISRDRPITIETYPPDLSTGLPGTRGEARFTNGEFRCQPGDLKRQDYNSGNGFNFRMRNVQFGPTPGATTSSAQGTAVSAFRCDNAVGLELKGVYMDSPSFNGALIRGGGRTTTLAASLNAGAASCSVASASNFLNAVPFYVVLGNGDGKEIVKVTSTGTGTNWTLGERGSFGTTDQTHASGVNVEGYWRCGDVQIRNAVVKDPSDGTTWAISHSHGFYWASDNGFDNDNYPASCILDSIVYRLNAARGGAYGVNCYENGDGSIISGVISDGFRRGGVTISGQDVHATDDSLWVNNLITNVGTSSPGPGYAFDSFMTGLYGAGSNNNVRDNLWFTALAYHRTGADANGITFGAATNSDPSYTNRSSADYRPTNSSPVWGLGDPDYMPETDIMGNTRTINNFGLGPFVKGA